MQFKTSQNRFAVIEPYVKSKKVLDIGCVDARPDGKKKYKSTGLHLFLKEHASFLLGIDLDHEGIEEMKGEGFNVIKADVETMRLGERFDCIVAGELIEHLSNPGLFLDNLRSHLTENGVVILTTPNAFGIVNFYRILRKNEIKVHAEHTCWYDPVTLIQLLKRHHFEVKEILFTNKRKWYLKRYFHKLKYQIPKLISVIRPYYSGTIIAIARLQDHTIERAENILGSKRASVCSKELPVVSIVVPAYNHAQYISECILSILEQDYPNIDLIVINDGSTDSTGQKIRDLLEENPARFRYISKANEGLVKTLNRGLKMAQGEYFCELASDDALTPGSIRKRVDYLSTHPEIDVVFADALALDSPDMASLREKRGGMRYTTSAHKIGDLIKGKAKIFFAAGMFRTSLLKELGGFDEDFRDYEDLAMKFQLAIRARVGYVNEPVLYHRKHATNTSSTHKFSLRKEKVLALEKLLGANLVAFERVARKYLYKEYVKLIRFSLQHSAGRENLADVFRKAIKTRPYAIKLWYYFVLSRLGSGLHK